MTNVLALPAGTELVGDYRIERVLGAGGFGITYLAEELALARLVTIKEYFPSDFAARVPDSLDAVPRSQDCSGDYQWGLDRFIEEAQTLALFDHRNIVRVYRYFRANSTAYMVLQFEEGASLKGWIKGLGRAPRQHELDTIVKPLLDALELIHNADYLHRDIAPDNIIVRKDGSPVLIDFGSARGDIARHSRTVSALVKPGYSPYEQYAENGERQGPWTDIYALGATLYHAISGRRPPDAPSRIVKDELIPAREAALSSYRAGFLNAIDRALQLDTTRRPRSIAAWRGELHVPDPPRPSWLKRVVTREPGPAQPIDKTRPLPRPAPDGVPPPPDVPGNQGRLLDYIEALKPPPAASPAPELPPPPPAKPASGGKAPLKPTAAAKPPAGEETSAPRRRRPPKPRPAAPGERRNWRPLLFKLMIGAGIAATAVGIQDRMMSRVEVRGSSIVTASTRETPARPPTPAPPPQVMGHRGGTTAVGFTEDGRLMVTAGADKTLKVWNPANGSLVRSIDLEHGAATTLAVAGRRALTGHADGGIEMVDIDSGARIGRYQRNEASVWSVAFAGDATRFLASSHDWIVAVWDTRESEAPQHLLEGHGSAVQAVAYSRHGPWIATGSADRTVKLWRAGSLSVVRTYRGHREYVTALAFSPDGRYLASAGLDGSIRIWLTSSSSLYRIIPGHRGRVTGLAFAPSGDHIATAGEDGSVRLWELRHGRTAQALSEGGAPARALAFSPDGRRLAVASAEGAIRLWDAAPAPKQPQRRD